jgi:hypothetical protein
VTMRKLTGKTLVIFATCIAIVSSSVEAWLHAQILSQPDHPTGQYPRLSHFQGAIHYTTPLQELGTILAVVGFFGAVIAIMCGAVMLAVQLMEHQQRSRVQPDNGKSPD